MKSLEKLASKIKPKMWEELVGIIGGFEWRERERRVGDFRHLLRRPISINSVLDGLKDMKLKIIQDMMSEIMSWN